jgi:hypothetical protein
MRRRRWRRSGLRPGGHAAGRHGEVAAQGANLTGAYVTALTEEPVGRSLERVGEPDPRWDQDSLAAAWGCLGIASGAGVTTIRRVDIVERVAALPVVADAGPP